MSKDINTHKGRILRHIERKPMTVRDLASKLKIGRSTCQKLLAELLEVGAIERRGNAREGYMYSAQGVGRHHDERGWDFYTAPCPICGHWQRLVKRPDGYYLIHCGIGQRVEV